MKQTQKYNMKKVYVGNINKNVTINDLTKFLGLKTTRYLQESCSIGLPTNENTGNLVDLHLYHVLATYVMI